MFKLPQALKNALYDTFLKQFQAKYDRYDKALPRLSLEAKHLKQLKALPHRAALLQCLPPHAIAVEVGVDQGVFSQMILELSAPQKLHLVDAWHSEIYHDGLRLGVEKKLAKEIESQQVCIHQGLSLERVTDFEEAYFDWVYIDTDHSYQTTLQELYAYAPKLKPGGLLMGHDYIIGHWNGLVRYGVMDAVHEFCVKEDWEMLYLTLDYLEKPSFALRKMQAEI